MEWLGITEEQVHVTNCRKDTDLTGRRFQCLIASYNFLGNLEARDRDLHFGVVIMDEAHYIKNKKVRLLCCSSAWHPSAKAPNETIAMPVLKAALDLHAEQGFMRRACLSLETQGRK